MATTSSSTARLVGTASARRPVASTARRRLLERARCALRGGLRRAGRARHVAARRGEGDRGRRTDTPAGPRHQRHLPREVHHAPSTTRRCDATVPPRHDGPLVAATETAAAGPRPGRRRHHQPEDEVTLILDAALAVMRRNGYAAASVADILDEAELSTRGVLPPLRLQGRAAARHVPPRRRRGRCRAAGGDGGRRRSRRRARGVGRRLPGALLRPATRRPGRGHDLRGHPPGCRLPRGAGAGGGRDRRAPRRRPAARQCGGRAALGGPDARRATRSTRWRPARAGRSGPSRPAGSTGPPPVPMSPASAGPRWVWHRCLTARPASGDTGQTLRFQPPG